MVDLLKTTQGTSQQSGPIHGAVFAGVRPADKLRELFYSCKFRSVLATLSNLEKLDYDQAVMKANALFELHRVPEARATLASIAPATDFNEEHLYASARLAYFDGDRDAARKTFLEIFEHSDSPKHRFRSLLGIANVYYSDGQFEQLPPIIEHLCGFEPLEKIDDRISLMIFLGNWYLASGTSTELAKKHFTQALGAAAAKNWNYFILRSLYGLASVAEKTDAQQELHWTLNILRAFVDEEESIYFSYLVNEKFKNNSFSIDTQIEFDTENKRILVKDRWLPFHDKPLLYRFLELLHERRQFVSKDIIATDLWPHEDYKPRVHDPRIFDIAKRARALIETYENQPVVLLSGRLGYKLAST